MARPSRKEERREEILDAMLSEIDCEGLASVSMTSVAASVGIDRTTLHHYFDSWDELLMAGLAHVTDAYGRAFDRIVTSRDPAERLEQFIEAAFGDAVNNQRRSRMLNEFLIVAEKDAKILKAIKSVYEEFEEISVAVIRSAFPSAPRRKCVSVARAITQLAEGCAVFVNLGFDDTRRVAATRAAHALLSELE